MEFLSWSSINIHTEQSAATYHPIILKDHSNTKIVKSKNQYIAGRANLIQQNNLIQIPIITKRSIISNPINLNSQQ